ncbi:MAG: MYG1 family protein [Dehalococcoidales bacterium]|nr:MYG1 family protein [Dehalococcoidales bacterium]
MDKNELIITHPGSAHFDEVTAISFILASFGDTDFRVERREPVEEDLDNPEIWVVDVGDRYEPEKRNFDHHQSLECPASFVLVAEYLGLTEIMSVMPWWHFKDEVDRFGPARSSVKYNAGDELVNDNPVENWLTAAFSSQPAESLPVMKKYGLYLVNQARLVKKQIDTWRSSRRLDIAGVPAIISETRDSAGLEEFRRLEPDPPDIVISLDRRDDGWRLFRFEGTPVDFSRIENEPEIAFAHKTGFLAKTKERIDTDRLVELVSKAVIEKR